MERVLKVTKEDFPQVSQYVSRAEELKALLASHNRLSFEEVRTSTDVLRGKRAWSSPAALLLLLEPRTEPARAHPLRAALFDKSHRNLSLLLAPPESFPAVPDVPLLLPVMEALASVGTWRCSSWCFHEGVNK